MNALNDSVRHPASFRDPSGFIFYREDILYRQINQVYKQNYDYLMESGLYETLIKNELLISHKAEDIPPFLPDRYYKTIRPKPLSFISYPYEWCFSQLKDAALLTLQIQKLSIEKDMTLKDASAYNIQFQDGAPIFIDTLSFEKLIPDEPWVAYRQFCQHFLAPLALMSYRDMRLGMLLRSNIDGIPLDLASQILPKITHLNLTLQLNIHMHAKSQSKYTDNVNAKDNIKKRISKHAQFAMIDNLESGIRKLKWKPGQTEWGDYYDKTNYSSGALQFKQNCVKSFISKVKPKMVWDFGANMGFFTKIATDNNIPSIAFDIDPVAVEKNYLASAKSKNKLMLPLIFDLLNPSPSIGWHNRERDSLSERGPVDMCMGLALVHHLAISNNIPIRNIAKFFNSTCRWLIIEFIPKTDSQVQRLLMTREDIFDDYTREFFESEFSQYFSIITATEIIESERVIYLMKKKIDSKP